MNKSASKIMPASSRICKSVAVSLPTQDDPQILGCNLGVFCSDLPGTHAHASRDLIQGTYIVGSTLEAATSCSSDQ